MAEPPWAALADTIRTRLGLDGPDLKRAPGPTWVYDYLFAIASSSWIVHIVITTLTVVVLQSDGNSAWAYPWYAVMMVVTLSMLFISHRYRHLPPDIARGERYGWLHTILTTITGINWGIGALFAARTDPGVLTFYTLVLGGTALGAVSSQHVLMRSCLSSIWSSMLLLTAAFAMGTPGLGSVATASMMLLFAVILTVLSFRLHLFVRQNVAMANELADKIEALNATGAALERANESRSRFLAQASHDLRQPIHAIGLFVECLKGMRIGKEGRAILENIDASTESLSRLCRSLLDIASLDVGRVRPSMRAVSLDAAIGEVLRQAQEPARHNGVTLRQVHTRLWVQTDPALFHTMLQNLVSNAVKYAPGAHVLVGVRRRQGRATVCVIDTGPGIPAQSHVRIFDEFVQLGDRNIRKPDGLGLGLSIIARLAGLLGLDVSVRSQEGKGSTFMLSGFDLTRANADRPSSPIRAHEARLRGLRVLVVDDDVAVREGTTRVLGRWGCEVLAIERIESDTVPQQADFLICDQHLDSGVSGIDVVSALRSKVGIPIPAAIITGGDVDAIRPAAAAIGATVLPKPVRPAQLRSLLLATVMTRESQSQLGSQAGRG